MRLGLARGGHGMLILGAMPGMTLWADPISDAHGICRGMVAVVLSMIMIGALLAPWITTHPVSSAQSAARTAICLTV